MFQRERNAIRDMLGSLHMTVLRNAERTIGPLLLSNSLLKVLRGGIAKIEQKGILQMCLFAQHVAAEICAGWCNREAPWSASNR